MKYKAEIFDDLQYLFKKTGFNDHQLHCVIDFKNKIDETILNKAVILLSEVIPQFKRVYRNNFGNSYWEDSDIANEKLFQVVNSKTDFDNFTFSTTDEENGPQIMVCLFKGESYSLSIIINHMIADGAEMKTCIYLLSDIYSNLIKNTDYKPDLTIDGERNFKRVLSELSLKDKIKILIRNRKDNNQGNNNEYPLSKGRNLSPFILSHQLESEKYLKIKEISKEYKVTVNDIILTAYFRVLSNKLELVGKTLKFPIMIDMRKYLTTPQNSITNLSSTVIIRTTIHPGESFKETLLKVNHEMNKMKDNFLGINSLLKLHLLYKICRRKLGYKILKKSLHNPKICMTNIGVIDSAKLNFEGAQISNAFVCGSIKYRPHFQVAVSSYKEKITFTTSLYGDNEDQKIMKEFLILLESELNQITH